jgi:6-phosphogluconolactonase
VADAVSDAERRVVVAADATALADAAARHVRLALAEAIAARGRAWIALSGGRTPRALYERLAQADTPAIDWTRVHVAFGDERVVPPDHADSNYGMAKAALLDRVAIPPAQVHRVRGESGDASAATSAYAAELVSAFGLEPGAWPAFDLVLLGVGADGHTASLFPHTTALADTTRLALAVEAPSPPRSRVSLTFPVLNAARAVAILAGGADKADAIGRAFAESGTIDETPVRGIQPSGPVTWLLDAAAAASLAPPEDAGLSGAS